MGLLDGRVAIVTGASRGIGAQIAQRFAAEGAAVAVAARTVEPAASRFAGTINETTDQIRTAGRHSDRRHGGPVPGRGPGAPGRRDHQRARPARHPGQQRGRHLLRPGRGLHPEAVRADVRSPGRGAVPAGDAGPAGNARARARLDPEHLLDRGAASGHPAGAVRRPRRHRLRHVQGGDRAVLHWPGRRALPGQHRGERAVADQGRADAGNGLPPPDRRRRPELRADLGDGRGRADALPPRSAGA